MATDKVVDSLPRGSAKQAGTSILTTTVANINGFLANPDAQRLIEYERALTTDETVASAIDFVVLSLIASLGPYRHPNPKIQAFVQENLNLMEGNHRQALGELVLSALWAGFGLSEIIWTVDSGKLWLQRLANYHPLSIHIAVDINGNLVEGGEPMVPGAKTPGVYQLSPLKGYGNYIPLPLNKTCLLTHRKRHGNLYGESVIRRIYKSWKYKDPGLEMWAIALDRYGTPVIYATVPNIQTGREIVDSYAEGGKRPETIADSAAMAISNIHLGTGLVLENPDPLNPVKLDTLTTGNNYGTTFENFIAHLDRSIYKGLLIPQTIFSETTGGGINSTSKTHFEVFKLMLRSLYAEFVEPFVEQVIGRLIRYNFNESNPGEFPFLPFDPSMAEVLSKMLDKMVGMGALDPSDIEDLNYIRTTLGAPATAKPVANDFFQLVPDKKAELKTKLDVAKVRAVAVDTAAAIRAEVQNQQERINPGAVMKTVQEGRESATKVRNQIQREGGPTTDQAKKILREKGSKPDPA